MATNTGQSCSYCGINSECKRCSNCKKTYYCTIKCQKQDWSTHKSICQLWINFVKTNYIPLSLFDDEKLFKKLITMNLSKIDIDSVYQFLINIFPQTKFTSLKHLGTLGGELLKIYYNDFNCRNRNFTPTYSCIYLMAFNQNNEYIITKPYKLFYDSCCHTEPTYIGNTFIKFLGESKNKTTVNTITSSDECNVYDNSFLFFIIIDKTVIILKEPIISKKSNGISDNSCCLISSALMIKLEKLYNINFVVMSTC